jgi:hypothetical protein
MAKVKIKTMTDIADKWAEVTPGRASYYEAGVRNPLENWEDATIAAMAAYKSAVSAADIGKRHAGGVKRAGFAKWQRKSVDLGVDRFGPGVTAAKDDYHDGYAPFQAVLAGLELPARKPRGDPANQDRTKEIGAALFKKRLALVGAGS